MTLESLLISLAIAGLFGLATGYVLRMLVALGQQGSIELEVKRRTLEAKERAASILREAEEKAEEIELTRAAPLQEREQRLEQMAVRLASREEHLDRREQTAIAREEEARKVRSEAESILTERRTELERIAGMTQGEAEQRLVADIERAHETALLARIQKLEARGRTQLEAKARTILTATIHRLANPVNAEVTTLSVPLPSEEVKGKIIGKEGRNIKSFERATGVDVVVDEAPDRITLSSFDPLRRQVAKLALEKLLADGRIQPTKIEEAVQKARSEIESFMKEKGEQAAFEVGVVGLDPKLTALLGRLHFRTSYGQNVLTHSIEMAHIAGMLATELGANVEVARTGALLHDIGKAVDQSVQGTHVEIGRQILEKFGMSKEVIQAMQSHHEEHPYETVESVLVQTADAVSAGRPGARRDTVERYLDRVGEIERVVAGFPGVEKAYAIQAGREIRVFVNPGKVTDLGMHHLARAIADRLQNELTYPGEIKVNVIRENRVVEFAR